MPTISVIIKSPSYVAEIPEVCWLLKSPITHGSSHESVCSFPLFSWSSPICFRNFPSFHVCSPFHMVKSIIVAYVSSCLIAKKSPSFIILHYKIQSFHMNFRRFSQPEMAVPPNHPFPFIPFSDFPL